MDEDDDMMDKGEEGADLSVDEKEEETSKPKEGKLFIQFFIIIALTLYGLYNFFIQFLQ